MTTTLGELKSASKAVAILGEEHYLATLRRDRLIRRAEAEGCDLQAIAHLTDQTVDVIREIVLQ